MDKGIVFLIVATILFFLIEYALKKTFPKLFKPHNIKSFQEAHPKIALFIGLPFLIFIFIIFTFGSIELWDQARKASYIMIAANIAIVVALVNAIGHKKRRNFSSNAYHSYNKVLYHHSNVTITPKEKELVNHIIEQIIIDIQSISYAHSGLVIKESGGTISSYGEKDIAKIIPVEVKEEMGRIKQEDRFNKETKEKAHHLILHPFFFDFAKNRAKYNIENVAIYSFELHEKSTFMTSIHLESKEKATEVLLKLKKRQKKPEIKPIYVQSENKVFIQ